MARQLKMTPSRFRECCWPTRVIPVCHVLASRPHLKGSRRAPRTSYFVARVYIELPASSSSVALVYANLFVTHAFSYAHKAAPHCVQHGWFLRLHVMYKMSPLQPAQAGDPSPLLLLHADRHESWKRQRVS